MQVVETTKKSLEYSHPREAFFGLFPTERTCKTCKAKVLLDSPTDIVYHTSEGHAWLTWGCPMCHYESDFWIGDGAERQMYLRGYRACVPNWWRDHGLVVVGLTLTGLGTLVILAGIVMEVLAGG
jgi:hypothetical protein